MILNQSKVTEGWDYFQNLTISFFNPAVQLERWSGVSRRSWMTTTRLRGEAPAALRVGLDDKVAESPYDLSLSERKLLSVATVLAVDPAIYLFDEPMMSLIGKAGAKLTAILSWLIRATKL